MGRDANIKSESDIGVVNKLSTFVSKTSWLRWNLTAFFVYDAVVASEVTWDKIVWEFLQERNAESGEDVTPEDDGGVDENVITFTEASNMLRRR